ncbi:MAG: hypothetical protein PHE55_05895 [Methylococcaceae bacterium]|nr:hypothetical protein [Methylococcaceae bacterium]
MKNIIGKVCLVLAASGAWPAWCNVDGIWNATGLTRIAVRVLNGKGMKSETT